MSDYDDDFEKDESNPAITPQKEDNDGNGMSWLNPQERSRSRIEMSDKGSSRAPSSRAPSSPSSRISSPVSKTSRSSSVRSSSVIASTPAASPAASPKKVAASPTKPVAKASSPTRAPRVAKPAPVEPAAAKAPPPRRTLDADRKSKAEAARALLPARGERSRSKPAVSKSIAPTETAPPITKQPPAPKATPTAKDLATLQLKNIDLETTIAQIRDQLNLLAPRVIHPRKTMSASDSDRVTKLQREAKMLQAEQEMLQRKIDGASNVSKVQSFIEAKEKEIKDVKERNKWLQREIRLNSRKLKGGHGITSVNSGHETNVSIDQQKARLAEECKTEAAVWTNTLERSKIEAESAVESRERLEQSVEALTAGDKAPNLWKVSDARQVIDLHEKIQAKLESCETLRQRLRSAEYAKAAAAAEAAESEHLPKNSEVDELRKQVAALKKKIAKEQQASVSRSPTKSIKKAPPKPLDSGAAGPIAGRRAKAAKEAASMQGDVTPKKPIPTIAKKVAAAKPIKTKEAPAPTPVAQPSPVPPSPATSAKSSRASTPSAKSSRASSPIPSSEAPTPVKHDDTPTKGPVERSHTPPHSPTPKSSKASSAAHSQVSSRKSSFRDVPEKADSRPATPPSKPDTPVKSASKPSTPVMERKSSTASSNHAAPVTAAVESETKDEVVDEEQEEVVDEVVEEEVVDEAPKDDGEPSWL